MKGACLLRRATERTGVGWLAGSEEAAAMIIIKYGSIGLNHANIAF